MILLRVAEGDKLLPYALNVKASRLHSQDAGFRSLVKIAPLKE